MTKRDFELIRTRKESSYDSFDLSQSKLSSEIILGVRAKHYKNDVFYNHPIYNTIRSKIINENITFIIGNPLAGKTRIVFDTLNELSEGLVIFPQAIYKLPEYVIPNRKDIILFIDELDTFCTKCPEAINKLIYYAFQRNFKCVLTCRTGPELKLVKKSLNHQCWTELISNRLLIPRFSKNDSSFLDFVNLHALKTKSLSNFDGNIGSLILPLEDMRKRFQTLIEDEQDHSVAILRGLKFHYHLYNYESKKSHYDEDKIRFFCNKYLNDELSNIEWEKAKRIIRSTDTELNFIDERENIIIEETYLDFNLNSSRDVIDESFDIYKINRILKELYRDPIEKKNWGFPMTIHDWNNIIKKEEDFESAYNILKHLPKGIKPNKFSFILLMKKTSDREKLDLLYNELRLRRLDSRNAPNSIYFGRINDFKELLEAIHKSNKTHLKFRTNVSDKLIKLASEKPQVSLEFLFNKYPQDHIYGNHVFIQICMKCCKTTDDYKKYVEPYIGKAHLLETNLFKTFIRLCSMLKQKEVAISFLETYFSEDRFFYCNEKANCIKDEQPLQALDLFEEAAKNTTNQRQIAMCYANYGQLVYDKNLNTMLHKAISNCYLGIKKSKIQHSVFPYLRYSLVLLSIRKEPIENLMYKVEQLITRPDIKKGTFLHILKMIDDQDKLKLLTEYFKPHISDEKK